MKFERWYAMEAQNHDYGDLKVCYSDAWKAARKGYVKLEDVVEVLEEHRPITYNVRDILDGYDALIKQIKALAEDHEDTLEDKNG